jgi:hypothetical protein
MRHRWGRTTAALSTVFMFAGISASPARAATGTGPHRALVVVANVQEVYDKKDIANTRDMDVFVSRLDAHVPHAPDVLLLQEVRHSSAAYIAKRLRAVTGNPYTVAVDPGKKPVRHTATKHIEHETAILVNTETMRATRKRGFFATKTKGREMPAGRNRVFKYNAYLLAEERATGMAFPLMSVHLTPDYLMKSRSTGEAAHKRWVRKIARFMKRKFSGARGHYFAVGGDFNGPRCPVSGGDNCTLSKFYAKMMDLGYRDSVRDVVVVGGVDYLFTKTGVYNAGVDSTYDRKKDVFYSDHQFRWSILGPDRRPPSAPTALEGTSTASGSGNDDVDVTLTWTAPEDVGDSNLDHYVVWRTGSQDNWRRVGESTTDQFKDTTTYVNLSYRYYVVAYDGAHNAGPHSDVLQITATR